MISMRAFVYPFVILAYIFKPSCAHSISPDRNMRAWTCHGRTQSELVRNLQTARIISSPATYKVMSQVDRGNYIPKDPYQDAPQSLGLGQTISAPHIHAHVLEAILAEIHHGGAPVNVLDVGCGSGYLTACFGRWMKQSNLSGRVYGVDILPNLVERTIENIQKQDNDLLKDTTIKLSVGNGWKGWENDPTIRMDAIHVGAAASTLPFTLATSLKVGGVMIIPIGPDGGTQDLHKIMRVSEQVDDHRVYDSRDYTSTVLMGVRYVPLVAGPNVFP